MTEPLTSTPVVLRRDGGAASGAAPGTGAGSDERPLVVLLHGRGASEADVIGLAEYLPPGVSCAALRAPIAEGGGFAWFENHGVGRPRPESLARSIAWCCSWLDGVAPTGRPVLLVGFSGGATFAGGLLLADPDRYAGLATLFATLPFDAGVPTTPGRLAGVPVLLAQGVRDTVIPVDLQERIWSYLHGDSGARTTGVRTPGGHGLDADTVGALAVWVQERLDELTAVGA